MNTEQNIRQRLKEYGLSVTQPRVLILGYLMENHIHPSIDKIYTELLKEEPGLSRTTVYNTVKVLAECGAVKMLSIDDNQVNVDEDTSAHGHLLCRECGEIIDVPLKGVTQHKAEHNFTLDGNVVEEVHQYYKGICAECLKKKNNYNINN